MLKNDAKLAKANVLKINMEKMHSDSKGSIPKKKIPNYGKSPKGVSSKNQKVQNSKFGLFEKRGGGPNFHFFPKFKKVQNFLGEGGGVKKIMDFFHNL